MSDPGQNSSTVSQFNGSTDTPPMPNFSTTTTTTTTTTPSGTSDFFPPGKPSSPKKKFGGKKIIATFLGVLLLIAGVATGIVLIIQPQLLSQQASQVPPETSYFCNASCISSSTCQQLGGTSTTGSCTTGSCCSLPANGCKPGQTISCYKPADGVAGTKSCSTTGTWGACIPNLGTGGGENGTACKIGLCDGIINGGKCWDVAGDGCVDSSCTGGSIVVVGGDINGGKGVSICVPSGNCQNNKAIGNTGRECYVKTTIGLVQNSDGSNGAQCNGPHWTTCEVGYVCRDQDCWPATNKTSPPGNGKTPTPQPGPTAVCINVKAYSSSWALLSPTELATYKTGSVVNFCVIGSATAGTFDKAQFKIGTVVKPETTVKRPNSTDYCQSYTILSTDTTFNVLAKIHHVTLGWRGSSF